MQVTDGTPSITAGTLMVPLCGLLRTAHVEIGHWTVQQLRTSGNPTTEGLYQINGAASTPQGAASWSLMLKVIQATEGRLDPASPGYWKREPLVYQSELLRALPPGVAVPDCLAVATPSPETVWLWLETIEGVRDAAWPLARYHLAANHLGQFNGRYLVTVPNLSVPWLHREYLRTWVAHGEAGIRQLPSVSGHPRVQRVYPAPMLAHLVRLWETRGTLLTALASLPQTLCHMDALRRNMIARQTADGRDQTVLLDWGEAGIGAPGEDLAGFVTGSVFLDEGTPRAGELDATVLTPYIAGLREVGWRGDADLVRRGYTIAAALRLLRGTTWVLHALLTDDGHPDLEQALGRPMNEIMEHWAEATEIVISRLDTLRS